jgi:curved DNA-binding protein CbpA
MSISISVNFKELKYNLYEVLGLSNKASDNKIKKNFRKLVLELHPDKNPNSSEDLYNHVIIANQVLTNPQKRKEYDDFLDEQNKKDSFIDLKNNFESQTKNLDKYFPTKNDAKDNFKSKIDELNKKHGYSENDNNGAAKIKYEKMKKDRESQVFIPQERISNMNEFNYKFDKKKDNGDFKDQIIVSNSVSSLGTYQPSDGLTTIGDYSTLYLEDSVSTGNFTSLDQAFKLQKVNTSVPEKSLEERMKEYKNQTSMYNNFKSKDFSNKNFNDWTNEMEK